METTEKQHVVILNKLMDFYQRQVLCDIEVTLKGDHVVRASSVVMAAMSPVFETMLTIDMAEARTKTVSLEHVSPEAWDCAVHFFFGSEKKLTADNAEEMLTVAETYQMDSLTAYCDDHVIDFCTPDNALVLLNIAKRFHLSTALTNINNFLAKKFAAVTKSAHFLELEKEELLELLRLPDILISEDDLCRSLFSWSEHKNPDQATLGEVLSKLHAWQMTTDFLLDHVLYHNLTAAAPSFRTGVVQEVRTRCSGHVLSQPQQGLLPRSSSEASPLDLVVLGHDSETMHCLAFSPLTQTWHAAPRPPRSSGAAAVLVGSRIHVMGGDNQIDRKLRHVFDINENVWISDGSFENPLDVRGLVRMDGTVYGLLPGACGSFDLQLQHYTQKFYYCGDPAGSVRVGDIIVARQDSNSGKIEEIDLKTGTRNTKSFPMSMIDARGTSCGDTGYFLSGKGDLVQIRRVNEETKVAGPVSLQGFQQRSGFGLYVWNQCLWVFGGIDVDGTDLNTVSCYSLQGEMLGNSIIPPMPVGMRVWAVINAKISKE